MNETEAKILPYLFAVLFGFILLNFVINLCLFSVSKVKSIQTNIWYWASLLLAYSIQGQFQYSETAVLLSFPLHFIPLMILSKILSDFTGGIFPVKKYLWTAMMGTFLTLLLNFLGLSFTMAALPMCLSMFLILFEPGYEALTSKDADRTALQKFIGFIYIVGAIQGINFALFRMVPDTQIIGYGTTFALYQILSVGMLALAFEDYSKNEKTRLRELVMERTEELSRTLEVKDTLFKVVLHDIATPIQGQLWIMQQWEKGGEVTDETLRKLSRITNLIKDIIRQVKTIEVVKSGKLNLKMAPVSVEQSLEDLNLIFEGVLVEKNLKLTVLSDLPPDTYFLADQNAFTTSVMCNLISNAIKFSPSDKELLIRTFLKGNKIVIEVEDQGIGMPQEMVLGMFDPSKKHSRTGTFGEKGTGFGMPLVKSFVDYFGGDIEVESRPIDMHPNNHGTKVTVTLEQSLRH